MKSPPNENPVGQQLKAVRERYQLSGREIASKLKRPQSYISKMETGKLYPSLEYIEQFSRGLGLSAQERNRLVALYHLYETEESGLSKSADAISLRQVAIQSLENVAKEILCFQSVVVPGLLQTPEYAKWIWKTSRFIFEVAGNKNDAEIDRAVEARMKRKRVLKTRGKTVRFLVAESALRHLMCPTEVLIEQLEELRQLIHNKSANIGILGWDFPVSAIAATSFDILDSIAVRIDILDGFITVRNARSIVLYREAWKRLSEAALRGTAAIDRLRHIEDELRRLENPAGV